MNSICVQDPLCLTHNVAELVDYKHCRKFFNEIMIICKQFQNNRFNHSNSRNFNLITILDKPTNYGPVKKNKNTISIKIPLICKENYEMPLEKKAYSSAQTLLHILQHILLFDCRSLELNKVFNLLEMQDNLISTKRKIWLERTQFKLNEEDIIPHLKNRRKKTEDSNEVPYEIPKEEFAEELLLEQFKKFYNDHKLILCAECKVTKNTWVGRESVVLDSSGLSNIFDVERSISEYVAKHNALYLTDKKIKPFMFLFECYISSDNVKDLCVNFRPLQTITFNPVLGIFLKEYITKLMKDVTE